MLGALLALAPHGACAAATASPSPAASPVASATPLPSPSVGAPPSSASPFASPTPLRPTASPTPRDALDPPAAAEARPPDHAYALPTAVIETRPRAFRTATREAPPVFVAPQAGTPPSDASLPDDAAAAPGRMPAARSTSTTVVFRTIARTAIEGFDLLVTYPLAAGDFAGSADQVQCTTIAGALLAANDHDDGTLRLLVASAQTLPSSLNITCRFTLAPGTVLDARTIAVAVREVASGGRVADRSLLTVAVDVR